MTEDNGQLLLFADETEIKPPYTAEQLPYFETPGNDGERLMNIQRDFLLYNSEKSWRDLWTLTLTVAGRIIEAERRNKGLYLSADDKADKQLAATEYLLRRYKKNRGYFVRKNFISAIKHSVRHAIYYQSQGDKLVDFVAIESMESIPCDNF